MYKMLSMFFGLRNPFVEAVPKEGKCHSEGAKRLKNPVIWFKKWMLHEVYREPLRFAQSDSPMKGESVQHDRLAFWDNLLKGVRGLYEQSQ